MIWWYAVHLGGALVFGYLLGSIPFGLVLTRIAGLGDIRKIGSGNIGATNVLRTGNKPLAAVVLLLDAAKGLAAVLLAVAIYGAVAGVAAALGAVLGHMYPVWLQFKGGKGMATAIGVMGGLAWPLGAIACAAWLAVAVLFRYSSLASLVSIAASAAASWALLDPRAAAVVTFIAMLVWMRHRQNIHRLLAGTEPRIGQH